jgi:hypothetical protein
MLKILGLSGKRGAGKDTMFRYIQQFGDQILPGWKIKRYGLADRIKEILIHSFDVPRKIAFGSDIDKQSIVPRTNITVRQALQIMGTDWFKSWESLHWVRHCYQAIEQDHNIEGGNKLAVITDIRYLEEVHYFQEHGAKIVRLTRTCAVDSHISETALDNSYCFDYVIDNRELDEETTFYKLAQYLRENL